MINVQQYYDNVISPTLDQLGLPGGLAAKQLVLGTGLVESNLTHLQQIPTGPARGFYQMESATFMDIMANYISHKPDVGNKLKIFAIPGTRWFDQMQGNCYLATAMCRVHYFRNSGTLPSAGDIAGLAAFWKKWYNTPKGAGKIEDFLKNRDLILTTTRG